MRWMPIVMLAVWTTLLRWRIAIQRRTFGREPLHRGGDKGLRLRERLAKFNTLGLIVVAIGAASGRIHMAANPAQQSAGMVLGFGGALLMFAAQMTMGASWRIGIDAQARTPLVTHGWYRFSRNPIYVFVLGAFTGYALLVPNVVTWMVVVVSAAVFRAQALREERWLDETYGDEWRHYAARVGRFVPWVGRVR